MADQTNGLLSSFLKKQRFAAVKGFLTGRILDVGCGTGALAGYVSPDCYLGIDVDSDSINQAKRTYPDTQFQCTADFSDIPGTFDTILLLAVVEHFCDPALLLAQLAHSMASDGTMVITTPDPKFGWLLRVGGHLGLLSKEALEDHKELVGYSRLQQCADRAGLHVVTMRRFLCGANQLFVLKHGGIQI